MASFAPRRSTEQRARTARASKRPSKPCKRRLRMTIRRSSPCKMWSSKRVTISSNREHFRKRTRTCRLCLCSTLGCSPMQGMMGWPKGKVIVSPSMCKPVQLSRPLFVNTGGLDGHQARTRRQIDALKAAREKLVEGDPKRAAYSQEINRCWWLYEARNRELAHLAANLLLLFAAVWGCSLI